MKMKGVCLGQFFCELVLM